MEERQGAPDPPGLSVGPALHNHDVKNVVESGEARGMTVNTSGTERNQTRPVNSVSVNSASGSPARMATGESRLSTDGARFSPASVPSSHTETLAFARKRLKLSDTAEKQTAEDISNLRRKLLENKTLHLKVLKDRYLEYVYETFFLQAGGNMMDYPTWRKRPATTQLVNFLKSHRLDAVEEDDASRSFTQGVHISHPSVTSAPQGAEIKIPGVGVTPVAVSTTLPAAVAQLSQQGSVPGRPAGGRHGMVFAPHRSQSSHSTPRLPGGTPLVVENSGVISRTNINHAVSAGSSPAISTSQEQIVEKAKQEAYVMQRICELQKEGLWTEKRLPKVVEPQRPKAHWDYLLEEMVWLAADFAQERKWKKAAAKKCARMVQKHFQEKAFAAQRAEKAQELQMRKIASFIAKEIKTFWCNVEKLVEFKQQTRLEEKRKEALDQQLNFIVGQTEKYSQQLAEGLRSQQSQSKQNSSKGSTTSALSDDEFCPSGAISSDDEETIAAAEKEDGGTNSHKDEIEALQRESQMDFDEFLNELPADYLKNRDNIKLSDDESEKNDDDSEFQADENSSDDEDTIMEQEKNEENADHKKEIDDLNAENEMSVEELRKKYSLGPVKSPKPSESEFEPDSEVESDSDEESDASNEEEVEEGLNALVDDKMDTNCEGQDMEDVAAIAESIQPTGNTLSTTQVVTKVPFLLRHSLREYQHIGLDWLVTMEQRKLNGILADEMGLGKTIQTIALLAHLACEKHDWGPHLIVVPTSVMLNWEMECKKWCPGFKILTYYGSQKERKLKRIGWTKPNAFHICITSYTLVIQDHNSFRRKKWKYLILDEAQNIKNFKSQRWQLLLNFQTQQRLLLTGTPLQNNLMELWSLMHFLMPDVFASHKEFKEWFSNPVTGMIEGNSEYNENIIKRLHKILRPFLLRRLKCEVEKQMPKKYEHVVMCRLSKRQRFLYDDFMSRAKTKETLASGNLLSVINVLMQLRKVCNHPNLFEVRPIISPFQMESINFPIPSSVYNMLAYNPLETIDLTSINLNLLHTERSVSAFEAHRVRSLQTNKNNIENIDQALPPPPPYPKAALQINVSIRQVPASTKLSFPTSVAPGTSPRVSADNSLLSKRNIRTVRPVMRVPPLQSGEQGVESINTPLPQSHMISRPITPLIAKQLLNAQATKVFNLPNTHAKVEHEKNKSEFYQPTVQEIIKNRRKSMLNLLHDINQKRCNACPLYGIDLRETCTIPDIQYCSIIKSNVPTIEKYMENLQNILKRFVFYIVAAMSPGIKAHISHGVTWKVQEEKDVEHVVTQSCKPLLNMLHPVKVNMMTHFPDPRLIQYDCGKLQTLDFLLRKLKSEQHRVLIFTQMTKMLDVLEAFLNFHGYIYLRLDGTTRVDQRQSLMERFNTDQRVFAFILSTRSGGVGVNLTGADTVIFYDSDWNPTMDAQAQDRCHRIGQTRDVHIFRLVSEKTIEENILRKANQKRLLGDIAIEGGNFTTACLKNSTIQELFEVGTEEDAAQRMDVSVQEDNEDSNTNVPSGANNVTVLETALAECEDEADVVATRTARAEVAADLAEFDESIPIEEQSTLVPEQPELSKAELELQALMSQLSPVERYAMRLVESSEAVAVAEQQAAAEMERQKRDWEAARKLLERPPTPPDVEMNDDLLTFSREDAINQMWLTEDLCERMPMWCPPTPPQGDDDVYIDKSLGYLYDSDVMLESQLPPVYVRRENKRPRTELAQSPDSRRSLKIHRKEESVYAPRSLFEKSSSALLKIRRDLKFQKYRGIVRPPVPIAGVKPAPRPHIEPENVPEWTITEDMNLYHALKYQGLPLNLLIISPAHTPNWDLAADLVNNLCRIFRSARQCRNRYESIILPREEGKLIYDANQKKQKKNKSSHKSSRLMRTSQLYEQDNNTSFSEAMVAKFDIMKFTLNKKTATPKRRYEDPKTSELESVLSEYGINYDTPPSPMEIATRRADRIAKEKQKTTPSVSVSTSSEQVTASVRIQHSVKPNPSPPPGALTPVVTSVVTPLRTPQRLVQSDALQRPQRIVVAPHVSPVVAKGSPVGTISQTANQMQFLRQQTMTRQMKVFHQHPTTSVGQGTMVQQIGVAQPVTGNKGVPVTVATIQMPGTQQRPQLTQTVNLVNKPNSVSIARTVSDVDINALLKRQGLVQQKTSLQQPVAQIFAAQQQLQAVQGSSGERVVSVNTGGVVAAGGIKTTPGILAGVSTAALTGKPGMKMTPTQQLHPLKLQQQVAFVSRKGHKLSNAPQLIVQGTGAHKTLSSGVTVQQFHQVMRQIPRTAGPRVIPGQIQLVGSSMAQARAAGGAGTTGHPTQMILSQVSSAALRQQTPLNRPQQITQIHQVQQQQQQQQQQTLQQSDTQPKTQ